MRNKNLLAPTTLLSLFFQLLHCEDKSLRLFLENHIITDIKHINSKHKDARVNTVRFMSVTIAYSPLSQTLVSIKSVNSCFLIQQFFKYYLFECENCFNENSFIGVAEFFIY